MYGDLTREVRLDSTSLQCAYIRLRERIPASGAPAPRCAEPLLRRTRAHLAAVCALSEVNFTTFVHLSARFIIQHKCREQ